MRPHKDDSCNSSFWDKEDFIEESWREIKRTTYKIPPAYYNSIEELLKIIPKFRGVSISYESERISIDMTNNTDIVCIKLENGLEHVLGFKKNILAGPRHETGGLGIYTGEYKWYVCHLCREEK